MLTHLKQTWFPAAGVQPGPDCLLELTRKGCCQAKKPHKRLWGSMALREEHMGTNPRFLRWKEPKKI